LYTSIPHNFIRDMLTEQKNRLQEKTPYRLIIILNGLAWSRSSLFYNVLDTVYYIVGSGTSVYKQVIGIYIDTNCAFLVTDLFVYCCERDFMLSLSIEHQDDVITAFNYISRYIDDLLNIENNHLPSWDTIYADELKLFKANSSEKQTNFLDLILSIDNGFVTINGLVIFWKHELNVGTIILSVHNEDHSVRIKV
jgi:hypothetical protein